MFLPETGEFLAFWRDSPGGSGRPPTSPVASSTRTAGCPGQLADRRDTGLRRRAGRQLQLDHAHGGGRGAARFGIPVVNAADGHGGAAAVIPRLHFAAPKANGGTFWPHVAAGSNGQFAVSYVLNYESAWVERWQAALANPAGPRHGGGPAPPTATCDHQDVRSRRAKRQLDVCRRRGQSGVDRIRHVLRDREPLLRRDAQRPRLLLARRRDDQGGDDQRAAGRTAVSLRQIAGVGAYGAVFQCLNPGRQIFVERSVYWGRNSGRQHR